MDNYPTTPLSGCVNDATAVASIMETNSDGSPNFSVKLETKVSTKSELLEMMVDLFKGEGDVCLFYFSGHGHLNEFGGYIVTPDYKKYDEGISMDNILKLANDSKIKNKVIILDCCHSGAFGSPAISGGTVTYIKEGVTILTASRDSETALEVNGHGLFTSLLLNALKGAAADLTGHITPGSVYAYIDQALGAWDQRPVFKTNITYFISLRSVLPPISLEILRKIVDYFPSPEEEFKLDPSFEFTERAAVEKNVEIFKNLQKFERVGLVVPVNEDHMYFAAINRQSCRLNALGYRYWKLVKDKKI